MYYPIAVCDWGITHRRAHCPPNSTKPVYQGFPFQRWYGNPTHRPEKVAGAKRIGLLLDGSKPSALPLRQTPVKFAPSVSNPYAKFLRIRMERKMMSFYAKELTIEPIHCFCWRAYSIYSRIGWIDSTHHTKWWPRWDSNPQNLVSKTNTFIQLRHTAINRWDSPPLSHNLLLRWLSLSHSAR